MAARLFFHQTGMASHEHPTVRAFQVLWPLRLAAPRYGVVARSVISESRMPKNLCCLTPLELLCGGGIHLLNFSF